MGRERRVFDPSWIYHVVAKGNNGGRIVWEELDRQMFVARLDDAAVDYGWELFAWCLMDNHAHFLIRAEGDAISAGMQELLSGHSRRMNARYGREGHLFRNRFFAIPLEDDAHAVASIAYVDRNPIRHGASEDAASWRHSSYRAHMGLEAAPRWLAVDGALAFFARDPALARERLARHVYSGRVPVSDTIDEVQRFEPLLLPTTG